MKPINLQARIKRNQLDVLSGKSYMNQESGFIEALNSKGKTALVGIKREDGVYTVIGDECIYYQTPAGIEDEISHHSFLVQLKMNATKKGKTGHFEFIVLENGHAIWLLNVEVMNALWNTVLLLSNKN